MTASSAIATIKIVPKPGRWGGYKVRAITERGGIKSFDCHDLGEARRTAQSIKRENPGAVIQS